MSTFVILLLCAQACFIQNVYGQSCWRNAAMAPASAYAPGVVAPVAAGAYGGEGIGDLAIVGQLPVAGTTRVGGQVPILGSVQFGGPVAAAGAVSIAGSCGCNKPYIL